MPPNATESAIFFLSRVYIYIIPREKCVLKKTSIVGGRGGGMGKEPERQSRPTAERPHNLECHDLDTPEKKKKKKTRKELLMPRLKIQDIHRIATREKGAKKRTLL